jgi:type I restriction enzyme S subunit
VKLPHATLSTLADFDPRGPRSGQLPEMELVDFLPMSSVDAEQLTARASEQRPVGELLSGFTYFQSGDVLVAKITPCFENGKIAEARLNTEHGFGTTEFHVIRPHSDKLDSKYLTHFLRQPFVRLEGQRRMTGSAGQRRVPRDFLKELDIPLPSIVEQRRIAMILDKADALRQKRRTALQILDSLSQSLFLEMFGDPATNSKSMPAVALGDLFLEPPCYGSMTPPGERGRWTSLRVGNIQDWKLDLVDEKYIDLPADKVRRYSLKDGDIMLARAIASQDHLGKCIVVYPGERRWAFDSHLMRLRLDLNRILPEYLSAMFRTGGGRSLFLSVTRRSAVQFNVNTKEMASLRIPLALIESQQRFFNELSVAQHAELSLRRSASEMDSLFLSLQRQAFSGGI